MTARRAHHEEVHDNVRREYEIDHTVPDPEVPPGALAWRLEKRDLKRGDECSKNDSEHGQDIESPQPLARSRVDEQPTVLRASRAADVTVPRGEVELCSWRSLLLLVMFHVRLRE